MPDMRRPATSVVALREAHAQPLALRAAAMAAGHVALLGDQLPDEAAVRFATA
jgi:hypothetical protein